MPHETAVWYLLIDLRPGNATILRGRGPTVGCYSFAKAGDYRRPWLASGEAQSAATIAPWRTPLLPRPAHAFTPALVVFFVVVVPFVAWF